MRGVVFFRVEALARRGLLDELHEAARAALIEAVERIVADELG
jgi:hypothetical protein